MLLQKAFTLAYIFESIEVQLDEFNELAARLFERASKSGRPEFHALPGPELTLLAEYKCDH